MISSIIKAIKYLNFLSIISIILFNYRPTIKSDDIIRIFPHDVELKTTRIFLFGLTKAKPRNIIKIWKLHIIKPYRKEIENGDYKFFIDKDYSWDVGDGIDGNKNDMLQSIGKMQKKIQKMEAANKEKAMKYVQNLTKL